VAIYTEAGKLNDEVYALCQIDCVKIHTIEVAVTDHFSSLIVDGTSFRHLIPCSG